MKRLLLVLATLLMLVPCGVLAGEMALTAEVGRVDYAFSANDTFVVLKYASPAESGWMTLYDADGVFPGSLSLPPCPGRAAG